MNSFTQTFGAWFGAGLAIVLTFALIGAMALTVLAQLDPERDAKKKDKKA